MSTFHAGTTTPQPTYTDSTGTSQNTNPIILGADGGANIWMGANAYKLILKDTTGATVWSVDNVNAGSLFPCASAGAIQIANNTTNGLTCDPSITINTSTHVINVGTLPSAYVTIGALGTPTTWTFDTTSPATACASIGCGTSNAGTINQLAYYATAGTTVSGTSTIPSGITTATASPGDNSGTVASTAYVALPGPINPSSVKVGAGAAMTGNQGSGTLVQHSTGTVTTNDCSMFDSTGNTVDAGTTCNPPLAGSLADVTGSRSFGVVYTNSSSYEVMVTGYGITSGSSIGSMEGQVGGVSVYAMTCAATVSNGTCGFVFAVPAGSTYEVLANTKTNGMGSAVGSVGKWVEVTQH